MSNTTQDLSPITAIENIEDYDVVLSKPGTDKRVSASRFLREMKKTGVRQFKQLNVASGVTVQQSELETLFQKNVEELNGIYVAKVNGAIGAQTGTDNNAGLLRYRFGLILANGLIPNPRDPTPTTGIDRQVAILNGDFIVVKYKDNLIAELNIVQNTKQNQFFQALIARIESAEQSANASATPNELIDTETIGFEAAVNDPAKRKIKGSVKIVALVSTEVGVTNALQMRNGKLYVQPNQNSGSGTPQIANNRIDTDAILWQKEATTTDPLGLKLIPVFHPSGAISETYPNNPLKIHTNGDEKFYVELPPQVAPSVIIDTSTNLKAVENGMVSTPQGIFFPKNLVYPLVRDSGTTSISALVKSTSYLGRLSTTSASGRVVNYPMCPKMQSLRLFAQTGAFNGQDLFIFIPFYLRDGFTIDETGNNSMKDSLTGQYLMPTADISAAAQSLVILPTENAPFVKLNPAVVQISSWVTEGPSGLLLDYGLADGMWCYKFENVAQYGSVVVDFRF